MPGAKQLNIDGRDVPEMAKVLRKGKVFIDWSQNADFKTTVGVYSLRAKTAQPFVSVPVDWDELAGALKKQDASRLYFGKARSQESKNSEIFLTLCCR
jgi:DNA primase